MCVCEQEACSSFLAVVFHECVLSAPTCMSGLCYYHAFIVVIFGSRKWFLTARSFQYRVLFMCVRASTHVRVITRTFLSHMQLIYSSLWVYLYMLDNRAVFLESRRGVCLWNIVRLALLGDHASMFPILIKQDK